jgi:protein phosphatase
MIKVQAAGLSDIGKIRKANEDSFLLNEPIGLYVVADGMGGHRGGGVASRIAVETIDAYMATPYVHASSTDAATDNDARSDSVERLCHSILLANHKIHALSIKDAACRGMGTTVSALNLAGNSIVTANVGDSPIYLLRRGEIENLYTPHTLLHERKKIPKSMEGRYSAGKLGHILTRAVGIRSDVRVDHVEIPCLAGDIIVLCSDGLSNKISKKEIKDIVYGNDSEAACKKLTDLANQRGGEDNITVIVVRITSEKKHSEKRLSGRILGIHEWVRSLFGAKQRS